MSSPYLLKCLSKEIKGLYLKKRGIEMYAFLVIDLMGWKTIIQEGACGSSTNREMSSPRFVNCVLVEEPGVCSQGALYFLAGPRGHPSIEQAESAFEDQLLLCSQ